MRRRDFLTTGLGVATGAVLSSSWLPLVVRAFGDEGSPAAAGPPERVAELGAAAARAKRDGKPLLLLVVPANPQHLYLCGRALGELITHGGTAVADDLLMCELACVTLDEARRSLAIDVKVESSMILVELDAEGGEFLPTTPIDLPPTPGRSRGDMEEEGAIRARIARGGEALHAALHPDAGSLARWVARSRAALSDAECASLGDGVAGCGSVEVELARRGAALLVAVATEGAGEPRARARSALDAVAEAMVKARPAGARWARTEGCGTEVEGEPAAGVKCGMGCVPALSQRFLQFYTTP